MSTAPYPTYLFLEVKYSMLCVLVFAVFCASVRAASSEEKAIPGNLTSNGTEQVGWVSSRPGRSTSEIIWSCVTVLLVCTYKCVHLNLPSQEENEAGWHRIVGVPVWPEWPLLRKNLRQLKWMAFILVAPEYGVAIAFHQYQIAKVEAERTHRGQKMSLAHGFFAQMGGFVIKSSRSENDFFAINPDTKFTHRGILTLEEYRKCFPSYFLPDQQTTWEMASGLLLNSRACNFSNIVQPFSQPMRKQ